MAFIATPPYHSVSQIAMTTDDTPLCDRNMNSTLSNNNNHKLQNGGAVDEFGFDIHSVMTMEILERTKGKQINGLIETRNEEVLRRVAEMQRMVENSEKYLNEQGELVHEFEMKPNTKLPWKDTSLDFENSDSESLSSSKVSSNEDAPAPGVLKHSDSLVLLAESINLDLSGITKGLNLIGSNGFDTNQKENMAAPITTPPPAPQASVCKSVVESTPKVQRRVQGLSQLLSDLHALSNDLSQSESDSESVCTPNSSPVHRSQPVDRNNKGFRTSFGLHSPDNLGPESKDTNLREYLRQLKEASNKEDTQDIDLAAKKLTELYGFEIGDDTFIDTDPDVIDLTAIPPPQTPDELDALSVINAAPRGFDDASKTTIEDDNGDLEKFLAQVTVAPPIQKLTPAKELTPEEIMSFIIPPPPGLADEENTVVTAAIPTAQSEYTETEPNVPISDDVHDGNESLYINALNGGGVKSYGTNGTVKHVIEYATVERKGPFSCCTKAKKSDISGTREGIPLPPRRCEHSPSQSPPERPPKSAEMQTKINSPNRQPTILTTNTFRLNGGGCGNYYKLDPPRLPPRNDNNNHISPLAALPPRKPNLPPIPMKPIFRAPAPLAKIQNSENSPVRLIAGGSPHLNRHHMYGERPTSPFGQTPPIPAARTNGHYRSYSDCPPVCLQNALGDKKSQLSLLCSPQMSRRVQTISPMAIQHQHQMVTQQSHSNGGTPTPGSPRNGQIVNIESLLAKTDVAMAGLLVKLDQIAAQCSAAQTAGGGVLIDEDKFQRARSELTDQALHLVTASKLLVMAMSNPSVNTLPEHLTSCLSALRRITELAQNMTKHTTAPLQTRNIVLKIHDVASSFRELAGVDTGPCGAGPLALQAECLANVLATLLRSLRVFSP